MTPSIALGTVALFLAFVLLASVLSKALAWRREGIRSFAKLIPVPRPLNGVIAVALLVMESVAALVLAFKPSQGFFVAATLFALYSVYVTRIPEGTSCRCFGGAFEFGMKKRPRIIRNVSLLLMAISAAVASQRYMPEAQSPIALGAAASSCLFAYAVDAFIRTGRELERVGDGGVLW
ncbi:MAG: MauE/DoxX family redox-associated membrane protein [Actinomycetota bacterium]|nr:hypothetical protein [Actinomycetota bacterium]